MAYEEEILRLHEAIDNADAIVVGAGAGLSTAAGLTYAGERFKRLFPDFIAKYEALIKDVMRRQPGAKVFVMGIPPCTKAKSASSTNGVTNQNISIYNSQILDMCSRLSNCYYVAVPESLMTADGALPADASGDGIHLNLTYSRLWADHICLTVMSVMSGH